MILAAGLGTRMRPLTDHTPKPLLPAGGRPLLDYHLAALTRAGVREVVINLAWLGEQIAEHVGDGSAWGLSVSYSREPEPLETGAGILRALPLLGDQPFLLINGDVWCDLDLSTLVQRALPAQVDAHLVLVPNPDFHPGGDFALGAQGYLALAPEQQRLTFAGISLVRPQLVGSYPERREHFGLGEVLRTGIARGRITGECYPGRWSDVGTPERLALLDRALSSGAEEMS